MMFCFLSSLLWRFVFCRLVTVFYIFADDSNKQSIYIYIYDVLFFIVFVMEFCFLSSCYGVLYFLQTIQTSKAYSIKYKQQIRL